MRGGKGEGRHYNIHRELYEERVGIVTYTGRLYEERVGIVTYTGRFYEEREGGGEAL